MKNWICAMLCLLAVVGLASVCAEASTEEKTQKKPEPRATPAAASAAPSATPTIVPTATPSVDTDKLETSVPTQLPPFTGNKVIRDEKVFVTAESPSDKTCTITGYIGDVSVTTLYIPAQINKKTVTALSLIHISEPTRLL